MRKKLPPCDCDGDAEWIRIGDEGIECPQCGAVRFTNILKNDHGELYR